MVTVMEIGARLAKLRKENHYKQSNIAEKLEVTQQVISNIECGVTPPTLEQVTILADLYDISLDVLVERATPSDNYEHRLLSYFRKMTDSEKELTLRLVSQISEQQNEKN